MESLVGVATIGAREPRLRERRLDFHHGAGVARGRFRRVPQELERLRDVRDVLRADLLRLFIVLHVVVAIGKSDPSRERERDHLRRVGEILARAKAQKGAAV